MRLSFPQKVIHLHGSFYISTEHCEEVMQTDTASRVDTGISRLENPRFIFSARTSYYLPYKSEGGTRSVRDYCIFPVPNKKSEIRKSNAEKFVQASYNCAEALLKKHNLLIVIGYCFNKFDQFSYQRLLEIFEVSHSNPKLIIIDPNAEIIATELQSKFAKIQFQSIPGSFEQWAKKSFDI